MCMEFRLQAVRHNCTEALVDIQTHTQPDHRLKAELHTRISFPQANLLHELLADLFCRA